MSKIAEYKEFIEKNLGDVFTSTELNDSGIHNQTVKNMVDNGTIYRIGRGLYSLDMDWDDEMYMLQQRYSKGIFSHDTALFIHGYSDRTPFRFDMTFPQGYNTVSLKGRELNIRHVSGKNYELGICELSSTMGNPIKVYNIERTLCDVLRGAGSNIEIVNQAIKQYVASREKNVPLLMEYARQLRVEPKIMRYLEVLM